MFAHFEIKGKRQHVKTPEGFFFEEAKARLRGLHIFQQENISRFIHGGNPRLRADERRIQVLVHKLQRSSIAGRRVALFRATTTYAQASTGAEKSVGHGCSPKGSRLRLARCVAPIPKMTSVPRRRLKAWCLFSVVDSSETNPPAAPFRVCFRRETGIREKGDNGGAPKRCTMQGAKKKMPEP
jgi:hypothetical protein